MRRNIYFDTNVIVDLFDASRPFHKHSLEVCRNIFSDESVDVYINTDTMTNLFYILRSHVKLNFDDAIAKMDYVKDSFSIVSSGYDDIEATLNICKDKLFNDYEDAMQFICALKKDCSLIITNNPKDFKNSSLDIITSKELCELWG